MNQQSPRGPLGQKQPKQRGTPLERRYYKWLHRMCFCVLTGNPTFEIAHTGGLSEGKGMGRKSRLETCLPLIRPLHVIEERQRRTFWAEVGFPDHLDWAARLYDIFEAKDDPMSLLMDMNDRANIPAIAAMLKGNLT